MNDEKRIVRIAEHYINLDAIGYVQVHKKYVSIHMLHTSHVVMLKEPHASQFARWLDRHAKQI